MNPINNLQKTNITQVTEKPLNANITNVSKRYIISSAVNETNSFCNTIENIVIHTKNHCEKQQIIDFYNQEYPRNQVVKLDDHNDLQDNDLLNVISCDTTGCLTVTTGRLFNNEPLLLIIDLTNMTSGEIARLNDLLSIPASCNGKTISNKVKVVIIIDNSMLDSGNNKPSADLWRRLARFNFLPSVSNLYSSSIAELQQANNSIMTQELFAIKIKEVSNLEENNQAIIDFAAGNSPQELLFGGLTLDDKGRIYFKNGYLQNIKKNKIILHNAPWHDSKFTDTLETALRQGGFRANGNWVTLPADLQLTKSFTSAQQLKELTSKYVVAVENIASINIQNLVIINSHNLEAVFEDSKLHETVVIATDTLADLTFDCNYLLVTDKLTEEQWLKLLTRVSILNDINIKIMDASDSSGIIKQLKHNCLNNNLKCQTYHHIEDALATVPNNSLVYKITKDTNWIEIWKTISLTSQEKFIFSQENTELLTALKQGKLVTFYGLETNLEVLKNFETLLIKSSYLLLNGNKIILENNNICLLLDANFEKTKLPQLLQNITTTQVTDLAIVAVDYQTAFIEKILEKLAQNNLQLIQDRKTIYTMFAKQLAIEKQQDQSQQLLAIHYRKAGYTIFAKQHRDNLSLYGYLKTQIATINIDNNNQKVADAEALLNWVKNNPNVNRNSLAENFWILARHCSPSCFTSIEENIASFNFEKKIQNKDILDRLANIILTVIPDKQKQFFIDRFAIKNYENNQQILYYNDSVRSAIIDVMLFAKNKLKTTLPISIIAHNLAIKIYHIKQNNSLEQATISVYKLLLDIFSEELLQTEFSDLATDLISSSVHSYRKQARKKQRLVARIIQYPIIFLQGISGTGKTYMAQSVVHNLRKANEFKDMPEPLVLSLGPETKASDLFGSQQLKQTIDDGYTQFVAGPILKWAMNDNPPLLILDEANLVTDGVLAPLSGLTNKQPQLSYAGNIYQLSGKHRIIITGNPNNYDGRHMDSEISSSMLTLHYKSMTANDLAELIIKPALTPNLPIDVTAKITSSLVYLYDEYTKIIKHDLTPRDLQDILARINRIIFYQNRNLGVTQVYDLVWHAFSEILFVSIINKLQIKQLLTNYQEKFAIEVIDNSVLDTRDAKFNDFFNQLIATNQNLYLSIGAVKKLVKDYWLFLDSQATLQGRRGLWVEGPAGWGKDCILNAVLVLWEQHEECKNKFIHINANPNQWDKTIEIISAAMVNGQKLVISEINLLPSRYLEGLFNDILTNKSNHGFMLFATVNPSCYSDRERSSASFMNRMLHIKLEPIVVNELYKILLESYPNKPIMIDWLFSNYLDLFQALQKQHAPIQLSLANLLETASKLVNADYNQWVAIFQQDYGLPILMLKNKEVDLKLQAPHEITNNQLKFSKKKISSAGKRLNFKTITQPHDYHPVKYFATNDFKVFDYRLKLYRPEATAHGICYKVYQDYTKIKIIPVLKLTSKRPIKLETGQLLGTAELKLSTDKWVSLPGISYHDECIGISHKNLIELGRCQVTGFLMVKLKILKRTHKFFAFFSNNKDIEQHKKLKLDFIIKPNLISLNFAKIANKLEPPNQDNDLKQLLDNKVFAVNINSNRSINKLQQIKLFTDKKQQMQELISWAQCFEANMDITSEGYDALIDAIRYQKGGCQHRAIIFQILAEYFGVPANCVGNNLHMFVEFSLDNKQTWISINLGGANNSETTVQTTEKQFLTYIQAPEYDEINKTILNSKENFIRIYLEKKQKLHNEPNQLINFLKFIVAIKNSNFSYIVTKNINTDLYNENFYLYVNNTTVDFSQALVKIFGDLVFSRKNKEINILKQIYSFFLNSYCDFILGKIPAETVASILSAFLSLIEENKLIVTSLLYPVEDLSQVGEHHQRAQKILDKHYSGFKKHLSVDKFKNKACYVDQKFDGENTSNTIKSTILTNILKNVNIKTDWSYSSTGKYPSVKRLATRKAAFPISKNQQTKEKNIYFYIGMVDTYIFLCRMIYEDTITSISKSEFVKLVFPPFIYWLFKQIPINQLNLLININKDNYFLDNSRNKESNLISPADYDVGYIRGSDTTYTYGYCTNLFCSSCFFNREIYIIFDLDSNRIKQVFGDSAILITKEIITECFQEYINNLQITAV